MCCLRVETGLDAIVNGLNIIKVANVMITKELLKNEIDTVENKQTLELVYQLIQWVVL